MGNIKQQVSILDLLMLFIVGTILSLFILNWALTPIVYFNYPHNTCVEVISPNPNHNCNNLPKEYQHEWTNKL